MTEPTTAQAPKFPMDGFADTCTGYGVDMHGTNDELGTGNDALCRTCAATLTSELRAEQTAARRQPVARQCIAGGHAAGSRYYDCIACYGD